MYNFLHGILEDKKGGEIFTLFGFWHFFYIALAVALAAGTVLLFKKRSCDAKSRVVRCFGDISFYMYVADFFLMPLAYGEIDIEKLPFHACTATCLACFLAYRVPALAKYRISLTRLAFISNLVYLIYPAGVMWHAVAPLSYRVMQTLLFHTVMTVYGFLTLAYEHDAVCAKSVRRDLCVIVVMTAWAVLGNYAYNGESGEYSHFFNWFFVVRDPFYALPEGVAPFVMPFLNIALFFSVEMLVHLVILCLGKSKHISNPKM